LTDPELRDTWEVERPEFHCDRRKWDLETSSFLTPQRIPTPHCDAIPFLESLANKFLVVLVAFTKLGMVVITNLKKHVCSF
jgi:hypothetical protein